MQSSGRFRFFAIALTLSASLFVLFTPAANGQKDRVVSDAVLAPGNPPLAESMVTRFTDFQAWLLEIPFTPQQRERIRAMLLQDWKKPEDIKSDMTWLTTEANFAKGAPDVREFIRVDFQVKVLKDLRADKNSPDSQWLAAAYDSAHQPIAAGNPPLTESMVSHYSYFIAWLLEIPLTHPLQDRLHAMLLEDWKKPKDLESDMKLLNWQLDMARYENADFDRLYVRSVAQPELIKQMRADKSNPDAQSLVAAYDAAHRPIAAGNIPLTRQASDAWTELFCFIRNQSGAPHIDATPAVKDDFARALSKTWALYSPEQQKNLSEMPQKWPLLRLLWMKGEDADRQKILAAWLPAVNPSQPADAQLVAASQAEATSNAFVKRDPNTVSEQDLLMAAKDADLVARQCRRQGTQKDLANAATWDERARIMRAGKEAFVNLQANLQANQQAINAALKRALETQLLQQNVQQNLRNFRNPDGTVFSPFPH
jgi:hypothetical protein